MFSRLKIAYLLISPWKSIKLLYRFCQHRRKNVVVSKTPAFETSDLAIWNTCLLGSKIMIEYGSGGSTISASLKGLTVLSVETDRRYSEAVNNDLAGLGLLQSKVFYSSIGPTLDWGIPIDDIINKRNLSRWRKYIETPWCCSKKNGLWPDLLLIDGRFRVACAAFAAIRCIQERKSMIILMDDFRDRSFYWSVLRIFNTEGCGGRMVKLFLNKEASLDDAKSLFNSYLEDPR